jgi:hypothetical protein
VEDGAWKSAIFGARPTDGKKIRLVERHHPASLPSLR